MIQKYQADVCGVSFSSRQTGLVLETVAAPVESVGQL